MAAITAGTVVLALVVVWLGTSTSGAAVRSADSGAGADLWTTRDQLAVATVLEASHLAQRGGADPYPSIVSAIVSELASSSDHGSSPSSSSSQRPSNQPAAQPAFKQSLVFWQYGSTALRYNTTAITAFCAKYGDCQMTSWCQAPSAAKTADGSPVYFMFVSTGGGKSLRAWGSRAGTDLVFAEPAPLWQAGAESSAAGQDVVYYTCDDQCGHCAFTYSRRRVTNGTVRVVDEDVLIDVIQNAETAVANVLCLASPPTPPPPPTMAARAGAGAVARAVTCYEREETVGMAAWLISCWMYPSQFAFSHTASNLSLLYTHTKNLRANDWADADPLMGISRLDVATGHVSPITVVSGNRNQQQQEVEEERNFQPIAAWRSPNRVAFARLQPNSAYWVWSQVWTICIDGGEPAAEAICDTLSPLDNMPNLIGFTADDGAVVYTHQTGTSVNIYTLAVNLATGTIGTARMVDLKTSSDAAAAAASSVVSSARLGCASPDTFVSFVGEGVASPQEVYGGVLAKSASGGYALQAHRYSALNSKAAAHDFAFSHSVENWTSTGETTVEAIVLTPASGPQGKSLVVFAHPGPNMAHTLTFAGWGGVGARYPVATLAEMGYVVVMPNIRGSAGYGGAFRTAISQDWGGGDLDDIFTGIQHAKKTHGVDTSNVHIFGWSYGGFLSAMALTHAGQRYNQSLASVCIGGGIVDLISHTGTADIAKLLKNTYGGYYWDADEKGKSLMGLYQNSSAMYNIDQAAAPTLLQHGAHDPRVPILQAFQLHYALQKRNVATKMLVYPGSGHIPGQADQLLNVWDNVISWISQHSN